VCLEELTEQYRWKAGRYFCLHPRLFIQEISHEEVRCFGGVGTGGSDWLCGSGIFSSTRGCLQLLCGLCVPAVCL
jgi:hypothetical protein